MLTTVSGTVGGQLRQVSLYIYIYVYFCEIFLRCCLYITTIALRLLYVEVEGLEESQRGLTETLCDWVPKADGAKEGRKTSVSIQIVADKIGRVPSLPSSENSYRRLIGTTLKKKNEELPSG